MARLMGKSLENYLGSLSRSDRQVLVTLSKMRDVSSLLAGLLSAIALEVCADDVRERQVLWQLEADHRAEVERISQTVTWPDDTGESRSDDA